MSEMEVLLFDLDGTLYDQACGYEAEIHHNIFQFLVETRGGKFDAITNLEEAAAAWQPIFDKYNLTKRGLLGEGYEFDGTTYDRYIRRGADKFIRRDEELQEVLASLSGYRKIIFTNAPEFAAHEILDLLGVSKYFEAVLGTEFLQNQVCKPEQKAFEMVLEYVQVAPDRICYVEDSYKNLVMGRRLGMKTVLVKSSTLENESQSGTNTSDLSQFDAVISGKVGWNLLEELPSLKTAGTTTETRNRQ